MGGDSLLKERRPAMMLLELIDCRRRALHEQASASIKPALATLALNSHSTWREPIRRTFPEHMS